MLTEHQHFIMLPSICRQSYRMSAMKAPTLGRMAASPTLRAAPRLRTVELVLQLSRRASTLPKKAYTPTKKPPLLSRIIIYHIGQPRIYMLGALKLSTIILFGFLTVVVLPTQLEPGMSVWQAPLVAAAAITPVLAIWYLTYPMVMWMHLHVPKEIQKSKPLLENFLARPSPSMDIYITTMSPVGKPRVTPVKLGDLKPVQQRGGLVNYVRDVTQENKERKWYQYRAIGKFMIQDQDQLSPGVQKRQKQPKWIWYTLVESFRKQYGASKQYSR